MSTVSPVAPVAVAPVVIPIRQIVPWALFALVLGFVLLYLVGIEQGMAQVFSGTYVHEFVHDGRHLLSFPCH